MSNHDLRDDRECANCGHEVEIAYCSKCGQKNIETRQSFWHLVTHFAEDFTHYDGAFWTTIKYLLFKPAKLTKEYLMGHRQKYVAPVKLYIFISFITFFLPSLYPESSQSEEETTSDVHENVVSIHNEVNIEEKINTKQNVWLDKFSTEKGGIENPMTYSSVKEMDSIESIKPKELRLNKLERSLGKRIIKLYSHNTPEQVEEKFKESFSHNFPKALFVYLPIFAFWLWLFHGKKRWYFFDHGIFTLHYFSFLLLLILITDTLGHFINYVSNTTNSVSSVIFSILFAFWSVYYLYRSHRKMYHEKWFINIIKCTLMLIINSIAVIFLIFLFMLISFYNLH
ncbi:DUF3667 domain-containing protein [Flavobacterium sp. ST-75]|uniref:DUF3667 domain-containing protein n=1 Tax=Flavobacterium rhizophilum TaxID=3163296 RepID=A0ABW8YEY1_9FLAO